jgi:2,3-diphosphopglycerate-independent phosphoglycerate mutase
MIPVAPGITPGSGPGHLGLFGYDPLEFQVGRGVIEALGLGVELKPGDVCARANFATLDAKGIVTDRRAGRIATEVCEKLVALLTAKIKKIGDTEIIIKAGKEHRFVVIFRGKGLEGPLTDADPNREGFPIPTVHPRDENNAGQKKMAALIADFYKAALPIIAKEHPANGFLMRGIAHQPHIPLFEERYKLKPACLAVYPMYKGLAQLVGMKKIEGPQTIAEQFERYLKEYNNYDFFFIHYKYTDKYGEDGNFAAKKKAIEDFDAALPILLKKKPDVLVVTGDHSTPVRNQRPFMASAAGVAALGGERFGQAGTFHRDRRELRFARRVQIEIFDPPDAGQCENVRQVRRVNEFAEQTDGFAPRADGILRLGAVCAGSVQRHARADFFLRGQFHGFSRWKNRAQTQSHHEFRHLDGPARGQNSDLLGVHRIRREQPFESDRARQSRRVDGHHHRGARTGDHRIAIAGGVKKYRARR